MPTVYISEFSSLAQEIGRGSGIAQIVAMPPVQEQAVAIGSASAAFSPETKIIRVNVDATCSIKISRGTPASGAATATTASMRMAANSTEYFKVAANSVLTSVTNT